MKRMGVAILALLLLLGGCGSKAIDINSAVDALQESNAFAESLLEVDETLAIMMYRLGTYDVGEEDIVSCRVFVAQSVIGDEMAFFEMDSEEAAQSVYQALNARVKTQAAAFQDYGPEEVPKFNQAVIAQSGTTVYLVVASDYSTVDSILK